MKRNYLPYGKHRWVNRAALVAQVVRQNQPQILGTQELTAVSLGDMQRLLPDYKYVGEGRDGGENGEYSAIFYLHEQFELVDSETFWLSNTPGLPSRAWLAPFRRICTTCRLQNRSTGVHLQIYNTHLDHISYLARINGLKLIVRQIFESQKLYGKIPVVLMGDFNATPSSKTIRAWEKHMLESTELTTLQNSYNLLTQRPPGRSYHGFHGASDGKPIDYIFTSKDIQPFAVEIRRESFDSAFPSDHYPVIAKLLLTDTTELPR